MARMSGNDEFPSEKIGESQQSTNWVLDYGVTCHMTPEVSNFIPGSLEDTYKHSEVADLHHGTANKMGKHK